MDFVLATLAPGIIGNPLSFVVFGAVAFSVLMCLVFAASHGAGSMYDQIGQGGFSREGDQPKSGTLTPIAGSPAATAEQEREIRQMLHARSERMVRRGEPALDVDAELARLLAPARAPGKLSDDAGLTEEVRQLVIARNERRIRQGLEPLDEDAEVARTLAEMDP